MVLKFPLLIMAVLSKISKKNAWPKDKKDVQQVKIARSKKKYETGAPGKTAKFIPYQEILQSGLWH